ncbi:hypothetical protein C8A05DRAFT_31416 [Staphylotrichum tortipilum]|uniref:Uncharacterized protein n=1 Tax=Staphylotrichum tortipilum TaxID=2831512 RepID=A0AAN6RW86_9PEZI|nr:hypothetical protein C8A05DRAFT_31416 [Staphylotrichum longicolle]
MLPFLEVDHLPSSSSFYSAIIQPLGLRYLATEDGHFPSITYGHPSTAVPVFQIRQVVPSRDRPLRTSRLVLSAPWAAAADDSYELALRADPDPDPDPWDTRPRHPAEKDAPSGVSARRATTSSGGTRVLITDFVGNMTEIVYQPPSEYPPHYGGSTVRYTKSTTKQATRILEWNYDVAGSSIVSHTSSSSVSGAPGQKGSRRSHAQDLEADDQPPPRPRRSVMAGSSVYEPATSARENSNGLSASAVVGTLLGVAAGAALGGAVTYSMTKSEKYRPARQEYDMPSLTRRSTHSEKYDPYSESRPRYVAVQRTVEKVQYSPPSPPPSDHRRPSPEFGTRHLEADPPRSRDVDDEYSDLRGRHPSSRGRSSSARPRSESASHSELYAEREPEHRNYTSSKSSRHPPIVQRSYTYDTPDRDSHVSTRSRRSNSTVRAPPPDPYSAPAYTDSHSRSHSRSSSHATTTTYKLYGSSRSYAREGSYASPHHVPLPDSRPTSYVSTRDGPPPESPGRIYITTREVSLPESRARKYMSSRAASVRESRAHTYDSACEVPLPESRAPSHFSPHEVPLPPSRPSTHVSAYRIPLPGSHVGSSHAKWEGDDDDDADSVAPSDSISCVGSRRSGRSRY